MVNQDNLEQLGKVMQFAQDKLRFLSNIEFRIYSEIARKSLGYGEVAATLSLNSLFDFASKPTAIKALKSLQEQNLIKRIKQQEVGPKQAYIYSIVFRQDLGMPYIQLGKSKKEEAKELDKAFDVWWKTLTLDEKNEIGSIIEGFTYFKNQIYKKEKDDRNN